MRRLVISIAALIASLAAQAQSPDITGLWHAQRSFIDTAARPLLLLEDKGKLLAEIDGARYPVTKTGNTLVFSTGSERFEGVQPQNQQGANVAGHWHQPASPFDGNAYATPVRLQRTKEGWAGQVRPQADTATFFLLVTEADKDFGAVLINPEPNLGVFQQLTRLSQSGQSVTLHGRFRDRGEERQMLPDR